MQFTNASAEFLVPDGKPEREALERITHLGIGAHQDDLEFHAFHGILECFATPDRWFGGVTCTDGAGSARTGPYATCSDARMVEIRREEQNEAARIGRYAAMIQLDYPSRIVKSPAETGLKRDLTKILTVVRPEVVYTHNLADKHETHIGVAIAALEAMRELPREHRPRKVIGFEAWRNLDWLPDPDKVLMNVEGNDELRTALGQVFDSQIAGGKRYDLAIEGRSLTNATMLDSHTPDTATRLIYGMDLTPLVLDESLDIVQYAGNFLDRFKNDVQDKLARRLGHSTR
ncbi:MAG TPA: PIG-L family deacetylase [Chthoniobacteraceae bacterium]|jgi:LmbE family N-acetylglucosaminyl deacetylase|nr:PIG-L family deacetylase [Chthoniobacteraceae bacterium]